MPLYKADPDLQDLHAAAAWITTVDDHETTNDTWRDGAQNHRADRGRVRDTAARRLPGLPGVDADSAVARRGSRRARCTAGSASGHLADLSMLDLRQYRDAPRPPTLAEANQAGRTMTGTAQENWLAQAGSHSRARRAGASSGTPCSSCRCATPFPSGWPNGDGTYRNVDAWDGFTDQRTRIQQALLAAGGARDAVFLTGDIHSTWASDLPVDWATYTGTPTSTNPSAGTEFVCTSVTSDNLNELLGLPPRSPQSIGIETALRGVNPHIKALEFDSHGASVIDITSDRVQCDWYYVADRTVQTTAVTHALSLQTVFGSRAVTPALAPLPNDCAPDPVVPEAPLPVMIPAAAALMVGGALALRRRNQAPAQ